MLRLLRCVASFIFGATPAVVWAQDSTLTALLIANRYPLELREDRLGGPGGAQLLEGARTARFVLIGEEHGVAETPQLIRALLTDLRPRGFDTFAIEVSPLQGQRLDAMRGGPRLTERMDTLLATWRTTIPFYGLEEERALLLSALQPLEGGRPMRIWGLDYDVNGDIYFLEELERLASPSARPAIQRARMLADRGLEAMANQGDPSQLFAWSAPDSAFEALRTALGPRAPARARAIVDVFQTTARINRLFLAGRVYESNLERSAYLRKNFLARWREGLQSTAPPRVVFKFGGSHMMRGLNYTHTIDIGAAATIVAEGRGERAFSFLVLGGPGTRSARLNPVKGAYEPIGAAEVDARNLAWLRPAVPPNEWVVFDMQSVRRQYVRGRNSLTSDQDRFLHAYDAIVVLPRSTPGTVRALMIR
jgi:hypothetical protein